MTRVIAGTEAGGGYHMSKHHARIEWSRESDEFSYAAYNRSHRWLFDSGIEVAASAAPQFLGTEDRVDPEEAFVAAISSCHMLTLLAICARKRIIVNHYRDHAIGYMEKNPAGKLHVSRVELCPAISFAGTAPKPELLERIHHRSHEECFIANSVVTDIVIVSQHSD